MSNPALRRLLSSSGRTRTTEPLIWYEARRGYARCHGTQPTPSSNPANLATRCLHPHRATGRDRNCRHQSPRPSQDSVWRDDAGKAPQPLATNGLGFKCQASPLRLLNFRGSLDVVHFRYGSSVHLPPLPNPPHGDAVEGDFRREQPTSTGGTRTRMPASFAGAGSAVSSGIRGGPSAPDLTTGAGISCQVSSDQRSLPQGTRMRCKSLQQSDLHSRRDFPRPGASGPALPPGIRKCRCRRHFCLHTGASP